MIDRVIMRSHPPFSLSFSCVCLWGGVISRNNQGVAFFAANLQDITRLTKFLRWKMPCSVLLWKIIAPWEFCPSFLESALFLRDTSEDLRPFPSSLRSFPSFLLPFPSFLRLFGENLQAIFSNLCDFYFFSSRFVVFSPSFNFRD